MQLAFVCLMFVNCCAQPPFLANTSCYVVFYTLLLIPFLFGVFYVKCMAADEL